MGSEIVVCRALFVTLRSRSLRSPCLNVYTGSRVKSLHTGGSRIGHWRTLVYTGWSVVVPVSRG